MNNCDNRQLHLERIYLMTKLTTLIISLAALTCAANAQEQPQLGFSLYRTQPGLTALSPLPDSIADVLKIKPQDTILYINRRRVKSSNDVSRALRSWKHQTRLSAIVHRADTGKHLIYVPNTSGEIITLRTLSKKTVLSSARSAHNLNMHEVEIRKKHLETAKANAPKPVETLVPAGFRIKAGERIWIRFPKGIPNKLDAGMTLEGITTTPMATDAKLDFIAISQGSRIWAQVLSFEEDGPIKLVRLHIYKIRLNGGHTYACSATLTDFSNQQRHTQLSQGGTLIALKRAEQSALISADANFQIEFQRDIYIYEPHAFYQAGPGLWLRTVGTDKERVFEVTHVINNRSADYAGIKIGDTITSIQGSSAHRLTFAEAIEKLYGKVGSTMKLRIAHGSAKHAERISLRRGMIFKKGYGLRYRKSDLGSVITSVDPGSPADETGIKKRL